jgi:hypothetical protein
VALRLLGAAEIALRVGADRLRPPRLWHTWEAQHKVAQMDAMAARGRRASIALVGSSMTNAAVDPRQLTERLALGRPAYNAALNAAAARTIERWTLDVVVPSLRPDVVVVGLSSRELNDGGSIQRERFEAMVDSTAGRAAFGSGGLSGRIETVAQRWSYLAVVLVKMPVTADAVGMHPRGAADYHRFEHAFDRLAERCDCATVDLTAGFRDPELFFNALHLDGNGRDRFTDELAARLAEMRR